MYLKKNQAYYNKQKNEYPIRNPITGGINPNTIPEGCAVNELNLPGKTVRLIGTAHTQDIRDQTRVNNIDNWLTQILENAPPNSAIFFEVPEDILNNRAMWDDREMFVAARATKNDCLRYSSEPSNQKVETKMLSEPYLSRWLKDENGNTIPADKPEDNPKKYKGFTAKEIYKTFLKIRNCHRITFKIDSTDGNIAKVFEKNFETLLTKDEGRELRAPSSLLKKENKPDTFFSRLSEQTMQIRDDHAINQILSNTSPNVFVVCGTDHVRSLTEKFNQL